MTLPYGLSRLHHHLRMGGHGVAVSYGVQSRWHRPSLQKLSGNSVAISTVDTPQSFNNQATHSAVLAQERSLCKVRHNSMGAAASYEAQSRRQTPSLQKSSGISAPKSTVDSSRNLDTQALCAALRAHRRPLRNSRHDSMGVTKSRHKAKSRHGRSAHRVETARELSKKHSEKFGAGRQSTKPCKRRARDARPGAFHSAAINIDSADESVAGYEPSSEISDSEKYTLIISLFLSYYDLTCIALLRP